ncbi:hypothetical protein CGCA056_v006891 [Colletotrichum aenigma]|uniref:uncharacterized protein n=1 Tax=Colletotrichum aenigma TaxID=1215731 RepID=UPI001872C194|nr:uncharacterized protein CGCA056_v006891 [Colletotrichum aenigma]KAF5521714.1 hypothetical protein CGCA056_v006891 [Colletotrichum aenigma]
MTSSAATTSFSALRIGSASGAVTDRRHGFKTLAELGDVQFIVGDWMSEMNMTVRAAGKIDSNGTSDEFERAFLEGIEPALPHLASKGIKVAVDAGSSDTQKLCSILANKIEAQGLSLRVGWIEGDEVIDLVREDLQAGAELRSLTTGQKLLDWGYEPLYAQCYLGSWGIVEAFRGGADIVICGRVADASPVIGCAAYHYGWQRRDYQQLASALVAGHMIECSTYVTGGNFSGFKSLPGDVTNIGFPIAEILPSGDFYVTKQKDTGGMVTTETCKAQLLYEIQGPLYYHSDAVAVLDGIKFEQVGVDRVFVSNIGGRKPPPTTKVGITAKGGFQAEAHYFLCGLDIEEKAQLLEKQLRSALDESKYHCLKFRTNGGCLENPDSQDSATVDFRVFAQARNESDLSRASFLEPITNNIMQGYPGATFAMDTRQALPKPYYEYWVTLVSQSRVRHICHLPFSNLHVTIPAPDDTEDFVMNQVSYETTNPTDLSDFGPCVWKPLGYVVHARSGDKGSDSNVGFFVRSAEEWDWLRTILTVDMVKTLLGRDYTGNRIFRFELPNIWAVHFLLKNHLDRGVGANSTYDFLGKNVAEYLRSKHVQIPVKFLEHGRI